METLKNFPIFLKESWQEVRHKVTWPGAEEVKGTTLVVVVTTLVFAAFLGAVDYVVFIGISSLFDWVA